VAFRRTTAIFMLGLLALLTLAAPAGAKAKQRVHRVKPVEVQGAMAVYRVSKPRGTRVVAATVRARGVHRALSLVRVRRAARRGRVRVRVVPPRAVSSSAPRPRAAAARRARSSRIARHSRLVLVLRQVPRPQAKSAPAAPCADSIASAGPGAWPSGCWRPYADSSPFNQPLPDSPRLLSNSGAIVRNVVSAGPADKLTAGNAGSKWDYWHPTYYSKPGDPVFKLHCYEDWGTCPIEGHEIHVPNAARPAAGGDAHMTVVDAASGWEYDLYKVRSKPAGGGTIEFRWGGRTRIDGDGLRSAATVSGFGNLAGVIRAQEMAAGEIRHALFMVIPCSSGQKVFPATGGSGSVCSDRSSAPPMGARFQLDMSEGEISALHVPAWKKTILRAMAEYGMYFGDTGGGSWGLQMESGSTYESFGYEDAMVTFARQAGVPFRNGKPVFDIDSGIDWQSRLRVVHQCVAQHSC
jgi:hypothetical protein